MIESRLDAATDDTGGGYGNYPGLTVAQIADRFRHLAEKGHNRSVRAILRIVHEQTSARSALGVQRIVFLFGLAGTATLGVLREFASPETKGKLTLYLGMAMGVTALLGFGALSVRRTAQRNAAQLAEIRRLALLALERVVEVPGFRAKPLEREHLRSLGELRRGDRERWERVFRSLRNVGDLKT